MSENIFELNLLEAAAINKLIPFPYKLEAESNITINFRQNPQDSQKKTQPKKVAQFPENTKININNKKNKQKLKSQNKNTENNKNLNNSNLNNSISNNDSERKICENFYAYIENCEFCNKFYTQKYLDEPCLLDIEKKIKNRKYHFLLDIVMDLRNLCNYYSNKKFNKDINYNANKLLEYVESTYKSFYSGANKEYKSVLNLALKYNSDENKYKIFTEKEVLAMSDKIKRLNPKQLIGLVKLIRTQYDEHKNEKYYEFNLNNLDIDTLNKIDFYIKNLNF